MYWVAATLQPTKKEREDEDKREELIMQPKIVVAKDEQTAAIKIVREADELKGKDMDRVSVAVSPF